MQTPRDIRRHAAKQCLLESLAVFILGGCRNIKPLAKKWMDHLAMGLANVRAVRCLRRRLFHIAMTFGPTERTEMGRHGVDERLDDGPANELGHESVLR